MTAKMSSDNALCQSSLEHTNSTKTLIFVETWHNTGINVIQAKLFLLPRHRAARLTWCRRYLRFRIQDWANILFADESRFHLDSSDGRSRVYALLAQHVVERCPAEM
jgi:hypothetical protein